MIPFRADPHQAGPPCVSVVFTAALVNVGVKGEVQRLHQSFKAIVAAAGDPDADHLAILFTFGLDQEVPVQDGQVKKRPASAGAVPAGRACGSGLHPENSVLRMYLPFEGVNHDTVDFLCRFAYRVHFFFLHICRSGELPSAYTGESLHMVPGSFPRVFTLLRSDGSPFLQ